MENKKPEAKFKFGAISASVWRRNHTTKDGHSFEVRQVSLDRTYKDASGDWQSTNTFRVNDLPKAVTVLVEAYRYLGKKAENGVQEEEVE